MAVAAYAAVVSLMHMLDQTQQYPQRRLLLDRNRIETLREKVIFLQDFLEVHSQRFYKDLEGLARQIAAVADEAEDLIDTHVMEQLISQRSADEFEIDPLFVWESALADDEAEQDHIINSPVLDQLSKGSAYKSDTDLSFSCEVIDNVIVKIDSIKKGLMMVKEGMTTQEQRPKQLSDPARSSAPSLSGNNTMVGFVEHLNRIVDELTRDKCDLQVLPIVGMGGIGKTTLVRNAFDNFHIMRHFDKRIWLPVSQEYSMQEILQGLLGVPVDRRNKESDQNLAKLGCQLHKILFERRYLIVLDDVWSIDVWNDIKSFFPDNKNGSRIMVTTRESNVADSFSSISPYVMDLLDENKSWDLLCKRAFAEDGRCPPELEEVGRSIAKSCKGLPLEIVVIGGLLSKSNMTREYWESVAKDVNAFATSVDDEHCLKTLSFSYNHLPIHLKPCFLYMRVFREDAKIYVPDLIRSWVGEGFLKPVKDKTLEEVAKEYLEDLIGRSLIVIFDLGDNGEIIRCIMHDLLRELCIRESQKEQIYFVPKVQKVERTANCFLCSLEGKSTGIDLTRIVASKPTSIANCLVCDNCRITFPQLNKLRFVKVLDEDILHPTTLRVLHIFGLFKFVDYSMHLLWNLQSLIIDYIPLDGDLHLPPGIWELPQLRHIIVDSGATLLDPSLLSPVKDSTVILENLQTLNTVKDFECSKAVVEKIPNLKKLGISYYHYSFTKWSNYSLHNLGSLHKLESLCLDAEPLLTLKNITFPQSLKKLSLVSCRIPWEEMTIIGSLPNLEELKLCSNRFSGPKWNPVEGQFLQLKKLLLQQINLVSWVAEKDHFPNLERLELTWMKTLEEVPLGIGEIETLRSIKIRHCSEFVVNSAKKILEEQYSLGIEDLQLYVDSELVLPGAVDFKGKKALA